MRDYDFDLERLVLARKMRTHCTKWSNDEILDELVKLHAKYHIPEIKALQEQLKQSQTTINIKEKYIGGLHEQLELRNKYVNKLNSDNEALWKQLEQKDEELSIEVKRNAKYFVEKSNLKARNEKLERVVEVAKKLTNAEGLDYYGAVLELGEALNQLNEVK